MRSTPLPDTYIDLEEEITEQVKKHFEKSLVLLYSGLQVRKIASSDPAVYIIIEVSDSDDVGELLRRCTELSVDVVELVSSTRIILVKTEL